MLYKKYIKRLLDILLSVILLPFVIIVISLFGLLIKLEDRGPIFYCGERLGKDGRVFKMYKLRSMKVNAPDLRNPDGSTYNSDKDPRLTRIGRILRKTSLDELPQIFNVLKGDMSFIGPRPDLPEHINYYEGEEVRKLEVLPGITGYNQAYFRNSVEWKQRLKNDIYYVNNISFMLDFKILWKTVFSVLMEKGIYSTNYKIRENNKFRES
ncbi:sugar transferase [Parageobacillus thermoglucosidasius]|uniref:sugar transferase n=1 Tax=Parageobacillus thermoglucosidasius TaxID=1426 RepID=UPI0027EC226C|nr:sugar transferase [Parageobacillus thermoglucosidasius]